MSKTPFITVIIPTRSINHFITDENLPALAKQTYRNFELMVLPNEESGNDAGLQKTYPWLKIIPTHKVIRPAKKRDIGAHLAKGEILAFIDDDAFAASDWLEKAITAFDTKMERGAYPAAVCGPGILPFNARFWETIFDAVLCTWIGSGGYDYRFTPKAARIVDDFPSMNFLVKKKVFQQIGGFHSEYWPGEDSKLCEEIIKKAKGIIYYDPKIVVYHHRRNSLKHYLKQHGNYGYHRGAFFAHGDANSRRITYLMPSFFVIYLLLVTIFSVWLSTKPISMEKYAYILLGVFLPLKLYKLAVGAVLLENALKHKGIKIALMGSIVLVLMHIMYGIMFIKGFIIGTIKKKSIY